MDVFSLIGKGTESETVWVKTEEAVRFVSKQKRAIEVHAYLHRPHLRRILENAPWKISPGAPPVLGIVAGDLERRFNLRRFGQVSRSQDRYPYAYILLNSI